MKKSIIVISILASLSANLFAEGIPSWYTEEVTVKEQEITRKNADGIYADFIDRTFSACAHVRVGDGIMSLEEARSAAEKIASEKLDSYFRAHNENEAIKKEHKLHGWSYDYSLATGGAYVLVQVVDNKEKPKKVENIASANDPKKELSEQSNLGRIIIYGSDKLNLVDTINISSQESIESHQFSLIKKQDESGIKSNFSKSKESFYYPDGYNISDTVYNITETAIQFKLRNVIKGRKTLIIMRCDVGGKNNELELSYQGRSFKSKIEKDTKNRWRNIIFEIEEGIIIDYSPKFILKDTENKLSVGTIFVYQLL